MPLDSFRFASLLYMTCDIRLLDQVVGFVAGYILESFRVTVYAVFGGVLIASVICVPDWGIFKGKRVHGKLLPH